MKTIVAIATVYCLALCTVTRATSQQADILLLDGWALPVHEYPLESYDKHLGHLEVIPNVEQSNNLRGYQAVWSIADGKLFLVGIVGYLGTTPARLQDMFGDDFKNGRVFAQWYSGIIFWKDATWPFDTEDYKQELRKKAAVVLVIKEGIVQKKTVINDRLKKGGIWEVLQDEAQSHRQQAPNGIGTPLAGRPSHPTERTDRVLGE